MRVSLMPDRTRKRPNKANTLARWDNEGGAAKGAPQKDRDDLTSLTKEEEHILRCLGAAVITQWNDLPTDIQHKLFDHAVSMGKVHHKATSRSSSLSIDSRARGPRRPERGRQRDPLGPPAGRRRRFHFRLNSVGGERWSSGVGGDRCGAGELPGHRQGAALNDQQFRARVPPSPRRRRRSRRNQPPRRNPKNSTSKPCSPSSSS